MRESQNLAVTLTLSTVVLVLDDAGVLEAPEISSLLLAEPPIHADPMAQAMARDMILDLAQIILGPAGEED